MTRVPCATGRSHVSNVYARGGRLPQEDDLREAAAVLNAGNKIVILAGQGALNAGAELEQAAEKSGRADYQSAAREGLRTRRQPVHYRRHWPVGH